MPRLRMLATAVVAPLIAATFAAVPIVAQDEAPQPPTATPNPVAHDTPAGDGTAVRLSTDLGDVVIGLFNESAPVAAENFLNLAGSGYYDGVGFHRVVPGFVVQGGDPDGTGRGGPGYGIPDEEVVGKYERGIVAMARTQEPNSQGSQFFFVLDDGAEAPLESARTYVIFGRVVEGMDVVDAIVEARPPSDQVEDPIRINSASVEQVELPPEPTPEPPTAAVLAAEALAGRIPTEIVGLAMDATTFTSEDILSNTTEDAAIAELATIADEHGTDIAALSIAQARDQGGEAFATILAASLPSVPGELVEDQMLQLVLGGVEGNDVIEETVAGQDVKVIRGTADSGDADTIRVFTDGDVVWFVVANADSLEEIVSALAG